MRRTTVEVNAIETIDNETTPLIIYCWNCNLLVKILNSKFLWDKNPKFIVQFEEHKDRIELVPVRQIIVG